MIVGVTHTKDAKPIKQLPALIKLAIGLPGRDGQGPQKTDYILFKRYNPQTGDWVVDEELQKKFGKPKSVDIVLIHDTPEEAFRTAYEMWSAQQLLCRGNGLKAQRFFKDMKDQGGKVTYTPLSEPYEVPCDAEKRCPFLESERCRPRGVLYFLLVDHLLLGAVCKINTTSFKSVRNIYSTLSEIFSARGTLRWLPLKLSVEAVTSYPKARDRKKTVNFVWTLTFEGLAEQGAKVRQFLRGLSDSTHFALEAQKAVELHEALEAPKEIQEEFYPQNGSLEPEKDKDTAAVQNLPLFEGVQREEEEWELF